MDNDKRIEQLEARLDKISSLVHFMLAEPPNREFETSKLMAIADIACGLDEDDYGCNADSAGTEE